MLDWSPLGPVRIGGAASAGTLGEALAPPRLAGSWAEEGDVVVDRGRIVRLRNGEGGRYLDTWCDADGGLHIDGQDLGPETA